MLRRRMLRLWVALTLSRYYERRDAEISFRYVIRHGKHSILLKKPVAFAQATLATETLYTPASTCIKFSVLLLYRRIFPNKKLKIVSWCITGFLITFALAQMLSVIIQCTPTAALWLIQMPSVIITCQHSFSLRRSMQPLTTRFCAYLCQSCGTYMSGRLENDS